MERSRPVQYAFAFGMDDSCASAMMLEGISATSMHHLATMRKMNMFCTMAAVHRNKALRETQMSVASALHTETNSSFSRENIVHPAAASAVLPSWDVVHIALAMDRSGGKARSEVY